LHSSGMPTSSRKSASATSDRSQPIVARLGEWIQLLKSVQPFSCLASRGAVGARHGAECNCTPNVWSHVHHLICFLSCFQFVVNDANMAPLQLGLGITDLGCVPGSDAAEFGYCVYYFIRNHFYFLICIEFCAALRPRSTTVMRRWRDDLYDRLRAHVARVAIWAENSVSVAEITATSSANTESEHGRSTRPKVKQEVSERVVKLEASPAVISNEEKLISPAMPALESVDVDSASAATLPAASLVRYAPAIVAFTGKRQWSFLFEPPLTKGVEHGPQSVRPPGWPFPPTTEVTKYPASARLSVPHLESIIKNWFSRLRLNPKKNRSGCWQVAVAAP
jgi:hypothetical protein